MKKKMVIQLAMNGDHKTRSKALRIAVSIRGVQSAALGEEDKGQIVVVGEGVDPVKLTHSLRKKLMKWPCFACFVPKSNRAYAELISIADADKKEEEKKEEEKKEENNNNNIVWEYPPQPIPQYVCYEEPSRNCFFF